MSLPCVIKYTIAAAVIAFATRLLALPSYVPATRSPPKGSSAKGNQKFSEETYKYLELFGDVFERVRKDYVEEVSDQELLENAINGMLTGLDPHSGYMPAKSFQDMQEQTKGEFGGLGIEVVPDSGVVKVVSPIDDTPASKAGIQSGDYIIAIDGKAILGLSLNEAVEKMKGPVNTSITVTIRRIGQDPFDVKMTRAVIRVKTVTSRLEGDIGYIRITQFTEQTQPGLDNAIKDIKAKAGDKLKGYVLDLRNNPGGLLDQAVSVADTFLDHGEIVSTRTRHAEDTQRFNAKPGDAADGKPMVVLINDGSASASEIVAGALQDHGRAILLGTKSFGKGSVQTIIPLDHGESAMRLTTARYYTPSGRSIQALGITPDIEVEPAKVEKITRNGPSFLRRPEAELPGALKNDTIKNDPRPTPNPRPSAGDAKAPRPTSSAAQGPPRGAKPAAPVPAAPDASKPPSRSSRRTTNSAGRSTCCAASRSTRRRQPNGTPARCTLNRTFCRKGPPTLLRVGARDPGTYRRPCPCPVRVGLDSVRLSYNFNRRKTASRNRFPFSPADALSRKAMAMLDFLKRDQAKDPFGGDDLFDGESRFAGKGPKIALAASIVMFLLLAGGVTTVILTGKTPPPPVMGSLADIEVVDDTGAPTGADARQRRPPRPHNRRRRALRPSPMPRRPPTAPPNAALGWPQPRHRRQPRAWAWAIPPTKPGRDSRPHRRLRPPEPAKPALMTPPPPAGDRPPQHQWSPPPMMPRMFRRPKHPPPAKKIRARA